MKRSEYVHEIQEAVPAMPQSFVNAINATLDDIIASAPATQVFVQQKTFVSKHRVLTYVLAAILLVAVTATAATLLKLNLFEMTIGTTPTNAGNFIQYDLASETIGNMEVSIKETAYDGMALYVAYSIRDMEATEPMGELDESGSRTLTMEDYEEMEKRNVGSWSDSIWVNTEYVSMPAMSSTIVMGSETPGEMMHYNMYRLDQANVFLMGDVVEVVLPIGEKQSSDSLVFDEDTGNLNQPEKGIVTFTLDCTPTDQIVIERPEIMMEGTRWNAQVSQYIISPIQMYVTLDWGVNPDVLAAYIEEYGDGYYEDGIKYYDYDGLEVVGSEIMGLKLVDEAGRLVFESMDGFYGCSGASISEAFYTFPYSENYPEHMYLALMTDGIADMTQAIQIR